MKKIILSPLFFLFLTAQLWAQRPQTLPWYEGKIELNDGRVLTGQIKPDLFQNKVLKREEAKQMAISPKEADGFCYFDSELGVTRRFISCRIKRRSVFCEVLVNGAIKVIREETLNRIPQNVPSMGNGTGRYTGEYTYQVKTKFFIEKNGELIKIKKFSQYTPELFGKKYNDVLQYANTRNLDIRKLKSKMLLVHYYNQLTQQKSGQTDDEPAKSDEAL